MSAAEFQRWGQRVVYHSAGAAMQDLGRPAGLRDAIAM